MSQGAAKQIAEKIEAKVGQLAPKAQVRINCVNFKEVRMDVYVFAPRKTLDMLRDHLRAVIGVEMKKSSGIQIRLLLRDIEKMTQEARKKNRIPAV